MINVTNIVKIIEEKNKTKYLVIDGFHRLFLIEVPKNYPLNQTIDNIKVYTIHNYVSNTFVIGRELKMDIIEKMQIMKKITELRHL